LKNLQADSLDLVQLHCPPTEVYSRPEVFGALDELTRKGKIKHYGVSVELVDEALRAIEYPNVKTVQIIFNLFRLKPAEKFLPQAKAKNIGVLARVPLASGLLTGKITKQTQFAPDDHRNFNRHGEAFDVGETFSGVDFDTALKAVDELKKLVPPGVTLAQFALKWILMNRGVTCVIPGAKRPDQVDDNARASDLPDLSPEQMRACAAIYDRYVRALVHERW
jgi:aryl-alcohol dehydrogenase-like predicted oxidoreductase